MLESAQFRMAAVGAAVAAAIGLVSGGLMRPDAAQFRQRPQQVPEMATLPPEIAPYRDASPSLAPPAYIPDPTFTAFERADGPDPSRLALTPVDTEPQPDTRPARDDRANTIREAQTEGPGVIIPPATAAAPADFPSLTGDTLRGLGVEHDGLAAVELEMARPPTPLPAPVEPTPKRPS